jgi:hypothetical protein
MTYSNYLTICCGVALSLLSCNRNNDSIIRQDAQRVIDCNLDDAVQITNLSDVFDSIILVPLDEKHLVGFIDKIRSDESGIYLSSDNIMYAYDWSGQEIFCLNREGRAMSDYLEIGDFALSSKYVAIADPESMKILLFEKSQGQYHKAISVDFFPEDIVFLDETTLAVNCGGADGFRLVILDIEKEEAIDGYFNFDQIFTEPLLQPFASLNGTPLYRTPFYADYYSFSKESGLKKAISFDFKAKNFNANDLKTVNVMGFNMLIDSKGNANIVNTYSVNSTFAINYKCQSVSEDSQYLLLVDTLNHTKYLLDSETCHDDILFYDHVILPLFYDSDGNGFISVLYPNLWASTFDSIDEERKNTVNYPRALSLFRKITKTENPSIMIYKLK